MQEPDREAFTTGFDEDRDPDGVARPGYAGLFDALAGADLDVLACAVNAHLEQRDVSFGAEPFVVDPVPRLIPGPEWDRLADGLAQRARALNCFLLDAYGERRIVRDRVVPAEMLDEAEGNETDLRGRLPQHTPPAAIIGFDLARDPDGEFLVLEDNLRTPSGFAYAIAARRALADTLPGGGPAPRPIAEITTELLTRTVRAAAPPGCAAPYVVVLSDGPENAAWYEHTEAAAWLGARVVTPADLERRGDRLWIRADADAGAGRPVDVVYRRTNEDRVRDDDGALTAVAELVLEPWLSGQLGLVNAFGNGVADDKMLHGQVEEFIRYYLGEEPKVRSVPTHTFTRSEDRPDTIDRLRELVVKPRFGYGGDGVVIGAHAEWKDLERLAGEIERNPRGYVSQPIIALSRHPTVIDGKLAPRHVDLRPFAFCTGGGPDGVQLIPGGLTRVALDAGALVVNSSQQGGGKDTWVFD